VPDDLDRARLLVGRSCHDRSELVRACDDRLDYVTLSPVTATASKPGYGPALGVAGLRDQVTALRAGRADTPTVLALGGVDADNAGYWVEAGADGVAVMGAVMGSADPAATAWRVVEAVAAARRAGWSAGLGTGLGTGR
jgi:thiamine-phosphate pyrophosphorylase